MSDAPAAKQPSATGVTGFLKRHGLEELAPVFEKEAIEKIFQLRRLVEEERFAAVVPDQGQRDKIKDALSKGPPAAAAAASGGTDASGEGEGRGGPRPVRACRDFHTKGTCSFGADCKFSHDANAMPDGAGAVADSYEENVTIQVEMVKFLLKDNGKVIGAIHRQHHTNNERIKNSGAFDEHVTFAVRGAKENVQAAIKAIQHAIGVEGHERREARYQYAANELEFNLRSIDALVAGQAKNKGTPLELSAASLAAVAATFRFVEPPKVRHFVVYAGVTDKEKSEKLMPLLRPLTGIQALLFAPHGRVEEMEKRASTVKASFRDVQPSFVHRDLSKEERMKAFDAFKSCTGNNAVGDGVKQRLLVTNNDFAKLARKVQIPYVNLVVHYNATDKETYAHQMMCTGRRGAPGVSLLFANLEFSKELVEGLKKDHEMVVLDNSKAANEAWAKAVGALAYDTEKAPLTQPGDYPGETWAEDLKQEKERMVAEGIVKQAPPKPKPKTKRPAGKKDGSPAGFEAGKAWGRQ